MLTFSGLADATDAPGGTTHARINTLATQAPAFTEYGFKVARVLLNSTSGLTDKERKRALRIAMDRIDPTLYARAEQATNHELAVGVPANIALERGIALAASTGLTTHLITIAQSVSTGALGDTVVRPRIGVVAATTGTSPPLVGGMSAAVNRYLQVGPWMIPSDGGEIVGTIDIDESKMTPEQRQALGAGLFTAWRNINIANFGAYTSTIPTFRPPGDYNPPSGLVYQFQFENKLPWAQASVARVNLEEFTSGKEPVAGFTHPTTGEKWGIYATRTPALTYDGDVEDSKAGADPHWRLTAHKQGWDGNVIAAIWDGLTWFIAKVVDVAEDIVDEVKDLTCALLSSQVGKIGAGAAGAAAGGPQGAQAAVQGANVVSKACASAPIACPLGQMANLTGTACVPVPAPPMKMGLLPWLLIGGAGLGVVLLLSKKSQT